MFWGEAQLAGVERDSAADVGDLITDAVKVKSGLPSSGLIRLLLRVCSRFDSQTLQSRAARRARLGSHATALPQSSPEAQEEVVLLNSRLGPDVHRPGNKNYGVVFRAIGRPPRAGARDTYNPEHFQSVTMTAERWRRRWQSAQVVKRAPMGSTFSSRLKTTGTEIAASCGKP
jgi:hypothetical protein